jgi:hypothetical protein
MEVKNFEDLEIWKDARLLTKAIYQMTKDTGFAKDFALRDQIRRVSMSVMSNIAKDSNAAETKSLFNFFMLPSVVWRGALTTLRSFGSGLCRAERL